MITKYFQKDLGFSIHISNEILEKITNYSNKFYPKEFGGILIGYYTNDEKTAVITKIEVPKSYNNSRFLFKRYVKNLNKVLQELYNSSDGKIIYLGEWHSHTNGSINFSEKDSKTMKEIEIDANVKILSPLLLIIAIDKNKIIPTFYIFHKGKEYKYEQN